MYTEQENKRVFADQKYWNDLAPEGYTLMGWTYRTSALFLIGNSQHTIDVTSEHVKFFKGDK